MRTTKVFRINGHLFVADAMEDAIKLFREKYSFPIEIEEVTCVKGTDGSSLAVICDQDYGMRTFDDGEPVTTGNEDFGLTPEELNEVLAPKDDDELVF